MMHHSNSTAPHLDAQDVARMRCISFRQSRTDGRNNRRTTVRRGLESYKDSFDRRYEEFGIPSDGIRVKR